MGGIPESQFETWSSEGSITQSRDTYATVKVALEADGTGYADKKYKVFLQGSYGNDTNIYAESDVDVVIELTQSFARELKRLPEGEKQAYLATHSPARYGYNAFRKDVLAQLTKRFGPAAKPGQKAVLIEASGSRRKSDVIIAVEFRNYRRFRALDDELYDSGIKFYTKSGTGIINYPRQHSRDCTSKHQTTNEWFKPTVRIFKNMRGRLIEKGVIANRAAPSYYIEGLLYNVPDDKFGGSYRDTFVNAVNWLAETDRSQLVCANRRYWLLRGDPNVTWSAANCETFLAGIVKLWQEW